MHRRFSHGAYAQLHTRVAVQTLRSSRDVTVIGGIPKDLQNILKSSIHNSKNSSSGVTKAYISNGVGRSNFYHSSTIRSCLTNTGVVTSRSSVLLNGLAILKRNLIQDIRQVLKVTGDSVATVRADVRSQGQVAWESLSHNYLRKPVLPPLGKLVSAASLACARSQVVPRIIAVIVGEATIAHQIAAETEAFQIPSLESEKAYHPAYIITLALSSVEFVILVFRALFLAILFTPAVILAPFADSWGDSFRKKWLRLVHFSLEQAGAAFIKWGQWAATRPDLFPRDLCAQLAKLHSRAPAHNFAQTKRTVEGAFGRKINEIFEDFEEEPVASGSIAQVHRAVLRFRYPGQKSKPMVVAVKVRHPGVSEVIRRDFTIINWCAKISNLVPGLAWLRLDESIQQFAVFMLTQVILLTCGCRL